MSKGVSSFNFLTMATGHSLIVHEGDVPDGVCGALADRIKTGLNVRKPIEMFLDYLPGIKIRFENREGVLRGSFFDEEDRLILAFMASDKASSAAKSVYRELYELDSMQNPSTREMPEGAFCAAALTAYGMVNLSVGYKAAEMERCFASAWLFGYCDKLKKMTTRPSRLFKEAKEGVEDAQFIVAVMEHYLQTGMEMPSRREVLSLPAEMLENFLALIPAAVQTDMESEQQRAAVAVRAEKIRRMLGK